MKIKKYFKQKYFVNHRCHSFEIINKYFKLKNERNQKLLNLFHRLLLFLNRNLIEKKENTTFEVKVTKNSYMIQK